MKVISYSLFGAGKERNPNTFDFETYLRGLMLNLRLNRLLFPDWTVIVHVDTNTFEAWGELFTALPIKVVVNKPEPLTKAMLWRLMPVFNPDYSHVICRDLDSPPTYREAQCVENWMLKQKAAHAITDSISHNIPMMGGMVGFMPEHFGHRTGYSSWNQMLDGCSLDWGRKGTDQDFLNRYLYPKFAQPGDDSITQHYMLGMGNTFLSDYHSEVPDMKMFGVDPALSESNDICGHIGAAGFYQGPMFNFLRKHKDKFTDLLAIEANFGDTFFWTKDSTFK